MLLAPKIVILLGQNCKCRLAPQANKLQRNWLKIFSTYSNLYLLDPFKPGCSNKLKL